MPNEENLDSFEIVVRDKSNVPAPKAETLQKWTQDRLAEDAIELYSSLSKALKNSLKGSVDPKTGETVPPPVKVLELAADILKLRDAGGININQNFGGNTTINNNGTTLSFEDLVRRQQARTEVRPDENIIDAEVIDADPSTKPETRS